MEATNGIIARLQDTDHLIRLLVRFLRVRLCLMSFGTIPGRNEIVEGKKCISDV